MLLCNKPGGIAKTDLIPKRVTRIQLQLGLGTCDNAGAGQQLKGRMR